MFKQTFRKLMFMLIGLAILGLFAFLLPAKPAYAANPGTINFQGKVTNPNGTNVADGTYTFVFRLYQNVNVSTYNPNASSCASDTNCWWEETDSLTVTSGVFQVSLGAGCAFTSACNSGHSGINFNSQNALSLTMKFNGDSAGFMTPLMTFSSVPYAYQADNSSNLGGIAAANFVQLAQGVQNDTNITNPSIFINKNNSSGTPNIIQLQKSSADVLVVDNGGLLTVQPAAALTGTGTQNAISQTITTNQTGGTVNGYNQSIAVSNASGTTTTNGFNISLTDNASSLANTDKGINIALSGSNTSQSQIGLNITTTKGWAISASTSGAPGSAMNCGSASATLAIGICGDANVNNGIGIYGSSRGNGTASIAATGSGIYGVNSSSSNGAGVTRGVTGETNGSGTSGTSVAVYGIANGGAGATTYGGYFTLNSGSGSTAGAALYASNSTIAEKILDLQDNTTSVFTVGDNGLITLQPAANLTSGQAEVAQTFTNGSSTGGSVNGYSQTITVNNTSSASTTNGFNISLNDTATALSNTDTGLKITIGASSTNTNRSEIALDASVTKGIGLRVSSTGSAGGSGLTCGTLSGGLSVGLCSTNAVHSGSTGGIGVYGETQGHGSIGSILGSGVAGQNDYTGTAGEVYQGVNGSSNQSVAAAYTSIGVSGKADAGVGATVYGGYFTLGTSGATTGAALYASNSTVAGNILDLQDNTTDVLTVADGGLVTSSTNSASGFVIKDSSNSKKVATVDTSGDALVLGQAGASGLNGSLVFNNGTDSSTAGITFTGNSTANYTYQLPTGAVGSSLCLQSGTVSGSNVPLTFASCSAGGGTSLSINGGTVGASANFVDTTSTSTVAGVAYANASGTISTALSIADGTHAGALNASTQTIGGNKTFIGTVALQPAASLTSGQTELAQTFTNGSSSGGTVNGYTQTITINNTSSASTTNGISIALSDATSLANTDLGVNIDLTGISNTAASKVALSAKGGSITQKPSSASYVGGADVINAGTGSGNEFTQVSFFRNYAYVSAGIGSASTCSSSTRDGCEIQIYDLSSISSPTYVGGLDSSNSGFSTDSAFESFIAGHYLYVTKNGNSGTCSSSDRTGCELQIYDISNPTSPTYVGGADSSTGSGSVGDNGVYVAGNYAYVTTQGSSGTCSSSVNTGCELQIYNVVNPTNPTYVGGADSLSGISNSNGFGNPFVQGRYVYVSMNGASGTCSSGTRTGCEVQVYDISNVASPAFTGGIDIGSSSSLGGLTVSGKYAYVSRWTGSVSSGTCSSSVNTGCEFMIYDISTPSSPVYVGGADSTNAGTGTTLLSNVAVSGNYAYLPYSSTAGTCSTTVRDGCEVQILDISNPASPVYVGGEDLINSGTGSTDSAFGIFLYGQYILVTKSPDGGTCSSSVRDGCELQIYDGSGASVVSLTAGVMYINTAQVQGNSSFSSDLNIGGSVEVGQLLQASGPISTATGVIIASTGNTGSVTLTQGSTSSNISLVLPSSLPGASNYCIVSTNLGVLSFSACGASSQAVVQLNPEYANAVLTPNSNTGNTHTGTMTSDFCSGTGRLSINTSFCPGSLDEFNYYSWTANAINDYDIFIQWQPPTDFSSISSVQFTALTSSTSDVAKMSVYYLGTLCGSNTVSSANVWSSNTVSTSSCGSLSPATWIIDLDLKVAVTGEHVLFGPIQITYNRK